MTAHTEFQGSYCLLIPDRKTELNFKGVENKNIKHYITQGEMHDWCKTAWT